MGVIKQLKQFITGKQIYPVTKSNAVYDNKAGRLDTLLQKYVGESDSLEVTDALPRDADTLGGHEPSYFGKQTDMDSLESSVEALNDSLQGLKGTLLWKNTSTLKTFAAQTVTLSDNIENYDYYTIECGDWGLAHSEDIVYYAPTAKAYGNNGVRLSANGTYAYSRRGYPLGNTFIFEDGKYYLSSTSGSTTSNGNCIPFKIIGYKNNILSV